MNAFKQCAAAVLLMAAAGAAVAASLGESFNTPGRFDNNWEWENEPAVWDISETKPGWLHIKGDGNRNLWNGYTTSHLYLVHEGDFDVETRVILNYQPASVVTGLVAYSPTTNDGQGRAGEWVTIKYWGRGGGTNNAIIQYQRRENHDGAAGFVGEVPGFRELPNKDAELFLRFERDGDMFSAWYKQTDEADWIKISTATQPLNDPLRFGIYAGVADAAGEMVAQYDYLKDNLTPFDVSPEGNLPLAWASLKQSAD